MRKKLSEYSINDIFNAPEFGLFYRLAPDSSIGPSRLAGRKKEKEWFTLIACVNGEGTEELPLVFIGKSKIPKFLKEKPEMSTILITILIQNLE